MKREIDPDGSIVQGGLEREQIGSLSRPLVFPHQIDIKSKKKRCATVYNNEVIFK